MAFLQSQFIRVRMKCRKIRSKWSTNGDIFPWRLGFCEGGVLRGGRAKMLRISSFL